MEVNAFLELMSALTGTGVKALKANEREALGRAIGDDNRRLDCSQLNELLLLVNKDRVEAPFFDYFFPKELTVALLPSAVQHFQRVAMLCYGNFVFAYRALSRAASPVKFSRLIEGLGASPGELEKSFKSRSPKILEVAPISRDQTYLIGYISARQITDENVYADLLDAVAQEALAKGDLSWDHFLSRVAEASTDRDRRNVLAVAEKYQALNPYHGVKEFAAALKNEFLPTLRGRAEQLSAAQQRATDNQDIYLTWDHMDVYFATSMRQRWEFEDLYDFVHELMERPELTELNLRYFDPTQSFTASRVDKGLVEALMLKRAKCTVYSVQDTDTLGKDSELAATLAQGKPVIAYVPDIDIDKRVEALHEQHPLTIRERLHFLAYADSRFASSLSPDDFAFVRDFKALEGFQEVWSSLPDAERADHFRKNHADGIRRLCRLLAISEKRLYDSRASTLKDVHPLGLQVHLETGVAQGVLVVRSIPDCADVLRRVLTNNLEFVVENHERDKMWYLREKVSGSVYRVVTQNAKLTNSFWNFYGRK